MYRSQGDMYINANDDEIFSAFCWAIPAHDMITVHYSHSANTDLITNQVIANLPIITHCGYSSRPRLGGRSVSQILMLTHK
jgi:hypothetical protein